MRPTASHTLTEPGTRLPGPSLIGAGVAVLTLAVIWPTLPATSGAALVALGATGALVNQLRRSALFQPALVIHLIAYVSLYLLFVGAVAHVAMTGPRDRLSFLQGLDLGVSAGLMTLVVRVGIGAIADCGEDAAR